MTILDRYIARLFLTNALLLLAFLCVAIVSIDFSLRFPEHVQGARDAIARAGTDAAQVRGAADPQAAGQRALEAASTVRVGGLALWRALDLWWPRLFLLYGYLLGPVLVGALGFTCAHLVKHRELVATLASGLSLWRTARPMILCALLMVLFQGLNRELLLPGVAPLLTRTEREAGTRTMGVMQDFSIDAKGRMIFARKVDLDSSTIEGFYAWERDPRGLMTLRIQADRATWRDGAWHLDNGRAVDRSIDGVPGQDLGRIPAVPVSSLATDVDPTTLRLRRFEGMAANLSTVQLRQLIQRYQAAPPTAMAQRRIDTFERIRWGRMSALLCTFLSFVVALPFFLRKEPANMLVQSLYGAPIALSCLAITLLGTTATVPGIPPQLSVFLPVLLLAPLAAGAVSSVRS